MAPHTPSMAACNHRHLEHADAPPPPNGPALDQAQPKPRKTLMPRPTPQPLPHSPPNRGQRRAAPDRLRPAGDAHAHPQPVLRASSAASRGTRKSGAPPWSISTDLMKLSRTANARRSTQQRPKHAQPNLTCRSSVWAAAPDPSKGSRTRPMLARTASTVLNPKGKTLAPTTLTSGASAQEMALTSPACATASSGTSPREATLRTRPMAASSFSQPCGSAAAPLRVSAATSPWPPT